MMKHLQKILLSAIAMLLAACGSGPVGNAHVPEPAKPVELGKYLGKWYEVARYENRFERGCEAVTAEYSLREDGMIRVINSCHLGSVNGELKTAEGKAKLVENSQGAKLKVSFFWPFYGDYWVLDHAEDYSWSIVGEPSGRYLWILARDAPLSEQHVSDLRDKAKLLGYDTSLLFMVKH